MPDAAPVCIPAVHRGGIYAAVMAAAGASSAAKIWVSSLRKVPRFAAIMGDAAGPSAATEVQVSGSSSSSLMRKSARFEAADTAGGWSAVPLPEGQFKIGSLRRAARFEAAAGTSVFPEAQLKAGSLRRAAALLEAAGNVFPDAQLKAGSLRRAEALLEAAGNVFPEAQLKACSMRRAALLEMAGSAAGASAVPAEGGQASRVGSLRRLRHFESVMLQKSQEHVADLASAAAATDQTICDLEAFISSLHQCATAAAPPRVASLPPPPAPLILPSGSLSRVASEPLISTPRKTPSKSRYMEV